MASERSLELKKATVNEIASKIDNAKTILLVDYQGMSVHEENELKV